MLLLLVHLHNSQQGIFTKKKTDLYFSNTAVHSQHPSFLNVCAQLWFLWLLVLVDVQMPFSFYKSLGSADELFDPHTDVKRRNAALRDVLCRL